MFVCAAAVTAESGGHDFSYLIPPEYDVAGGGHVDGAMTVL